MAGLRLLSAGLRLLAAVALGRHKAAEWSGRNLVACPVVVAESWPQTSLDSPGGDQAAGRRVQ